MYFGIMQRQVVTVTLSLPCIYFNECKQKYHFKFYGFAHFHKDLADFIHFLKIKADLLSWLKKLISYSVSCSTFFYAPTHMFLFLFFSIYSLYFEHISFTVFFIISVWGPTGNNESGRKHFCGCTPGDSGAGCCNLQ